MFRRKSTTRIITHDLRDAPKSFKENLNSVLEREALNPQKGARIGLSHKVILKGDHETAIIVRGSKISLLFEESEELNSSNAFPELSRSLSGF